MGMIWSVATSTAEDRQTPDDTPCKWSDCVHKVSSIIFARHGNADRIICVNDPYDAAYSTKDDERDLRVPGKAHVSNTYMKLADPSPARAFKSVRCIVSNNGRLQKLICSYLTDLAQSVDAEIIYSVGSHCTNLSTQQPMQNYSFDQSVADTVFFCAYAILRESGYSGPIVIDASDTDTNVAAAVISYQLPSVLCSCMTGCDANSGFYGKGKKSVYDQVAKSHVARRPLSLCGESFDLEKDVVEQLFEFTHDMSSSEARTAKWKRMKNKSIIRLPPYAEGLRQHCLRAKYLAYIMRHPSLRHLPSPLGHGWELVGGTCRPVRHTRPPLPTLLHQGQQKRAGKTTARRRMLMREMMYRGGRGIYLILNVVRQNDAEAECSDSG